MCRCASSKSAHQRFKKKTIFQPSLTHKTQAPYYTFLSYRHDSITVVRAIIRTIQHRTSKPSVWFPPSLFLTSLSLSLFIPQPCPYAIRQMPTISPFENNSLFSIFKSAHPSLILFKTHIQRPYIHGYFPNNPPFILSEQSWFPILSYLVLQFFNNLSAPSLHRSSMQKSDKIYRKE